MKIVYTHTRLDTNEVFYVGMGSLSRAYDKERRNEEWKLASSKLGYKVTVVGSNLTKVQALRLEAFLIAEYGLEYLVNLQTGGLTPKHAEESLEKMRARGNACIDIATGIEYRNLKEAAKAIGRGRTTITAQLMGQNPMKDYNTIRFLKKK